MTDYDTPVLSITGRVNTIREYSLRELLAMERVEAEDVLMACGSGEPKGMVSGIKGVLLTDIIHGAEVNIAAHNDTKKMYVAASAEDGYCALFSWQEIFNTAVGEGVMLVLEKEGKKLYEQEGRVDLFSARDILSGPRYVKRLKTLQVAIVESDIA